MGYVGKLKWLENQIYNQGFDSQKIPILL